ncbi:uncharacterized [Tachysurus ichikawai]
MALSVEKDAAQRGDKDDSQSVPHPLWFPSLRQVKKVKTGWLKMCYHVKSDAHQTEGADPNPSLPFQHNPVRSQGQQLSRGNSMA